MGTSPRITNNYEAELYGLLGDLAMIPIQYAVVHCTDSQSVLSVAGHFYDDSPRTQYKTTNHLEYRALSRLIKARLDIGSDTVGQKVKAHDTDPHNNRVDLLAKAAAHPETKKVGEYTPQSRFLDELVDYFAPPVWFTLTPYTSAPTGKMTLARDTPQGVAQCPRASVFKAINAMMRDEAQAAMLNTSSQNLSLPSDKEYNAPLLRRALSGQLHSPYHPQLYSEISRLFLIQSNLSKKNSN